MIIHDYDFSRQESIQKMITGGYPEIQKVTTERRRITWFKNIGKRLIKSLKSYLTDTGLLSYLMGMGQNRFETDPKFIGQLLESFVMQELFKQATWSETLPNIFYYRSVSGKEVDFILETQSGNIVGIEVKYRQ